MALRLARILSLAALALPAPGLELTVSGPLITTCPLATDLPAGLVDLVLVVNQPSTPLPENCGITCWVRSGGCWRMQPCLLDGVQWPMTFHLRLPCLASGGEAGVTTWMAGSGHASVEISATITCQPAAPAPRLLDLELPSLGRDGQVHLDAGAAVQVCLRPDVGFAPEARLACTRADGLSAGVAFTADGDRWTGVLHLREPGSYHCAITACVDGRSVTWPLPEVEVAPTQDTPAWQQVALGAPLTTTTPVALGEHGGGVALRVWTPDDLAGKVCLALEAVDGAGQALACDPPVALSCGDQQVVLHVRTGAPSKARLAWWCAQPVDAHAGLYTASIQVLSRPAMKEPCRLLDLSLERSRCDCLTLLARPCGTPIPATVRLVPDDEGGSGPRLTILPRSVRGADGASWWRWTIGATPPAYHAVLVQAGTGTNDGPAWTVPVALLHSHEHEAWSPVALAAPLTTFLPMNVALTGPLRLQGMLLVAGGEASDAHLLAWANDGRGAWWQQDLGPLAPGVRAIECDLDPDGHWADVRGALAWGANTCAEIRSVGLAITCSAPGSLQVWSGSWSTRPLSPATRTARLVDLAVTSWAHLCGERFEVQCRIDPVPANPCDPRQGALDLVVVPFGAEQHPLRLPAVWCVPMARRDLGDSEAVEPSGPGRFIARFRPSQPGGYHLRLEYTGPDGGSIAADLPDLHVDGPAHDLIAHVDARDPRFLSADTSFIWPLGPNLRSVHDDRAQEHMHTGFTPERGSFAYDAYLQRLAAGGATAVEVWMSPWNLALEWRGDWSPYHGIGRYSQEHAWGIEHVLDTAWSLGMRVVLVVNNHGQASDFCDQDWANNPQNAACGGPLHSPVEIFSDAGALEDQQRLRRYLAGRYGDHPGLLLWKLWSEMNLTNGRENLFPWHQQAVAQWHALDAYHHPVASHWCSDVSKVDRRTASLLDVVCIDAYHDPDVRMEDLLTRSATGAGVGLLTLHRPFLVSEYGGTPMGGPQEQIRAEHHHGPWVALFTGAAAAPMLWWFEWIDQQQDFTPYRAIGRFLQGEDLRGGAFSSLGDLPAWWWGGRWRLKHRILGYILARSSPNAAAPDPQPVDLMLFTGTSAPWQITWWDADRGEVTGTETVTPADGQIHVRTPPISDHLAFKAIMCPAP